MIGTTRRINSVTDTIEWTRQPSQGSNPPPVNQKESIIYRIHPELEGSKLIFQIGTSNPEYAVQAARLVAGDVAGIDVNAGCPKPFSTHAGMGAALLKTPDKLVSILEALVANITPEFQIGISVKIRILDTAEETAALVRRLVATGITGLTVHCRTTPMRPREKAIRGQLRMVANICHEAGVACLMNGDVESRDQAAQLVQEFGVDGAMIATSAEKNPSCFRSEADGGLAPWHEVCERYVNYAMQVHNKFGNTKYLLAQMVPGKRAEYKVMSQCKSYTTLCEAFGWENLRQTALDADDALDIDPDRTTASKKVKKGSNSTALAAGGQMAKTHSRDAHSRPKLSERRINSIAETTGVESAVAV